MCLRVFLACWLLRAVESGDYISESWKWIDVFRRGGLSMPWSEGYVWAWEGGLIGTQQMNEIRQDMFRAGIRNSQPVDGNYDHNILYYVMSHWPGNNAYHSFEWLVITIACRWHQVYVMLARSSANLVQASSVRRTRPWNQDTGDWPSGQHNTFLIYAE